jgi:hypothetical protein
MVSEIRFWLGLCYWYQNGHWRCFGCWRIQQDKAQFTRQIATHTRYLLLSELRLTCVRSIGHVIVLRQCPDRAIRISVTIDSYINVIIHMFILLALCVIRTARIKCVASETHRRRHRVIAHVAHSITVLTRHILSALEYTFSTRVCERMI